MIVQQILQILQIAVFGLLGLGIVVFVHELGHLIAAKLVGIEVEAFSIGWGRKLVGVTWRGTEYRISIFPIGGYCKMKGERSYTRALDENLKEIPRDPGTFFAAPPWKRIIALVAGPVANFAFAVLVFWIIGFVGFDQSYGNRIVIASEYTPERDSSAALSAGLMTGDRVVEIDGKPVTSFENIREAEIQNALRPTEFTVERNGALYTVVAVPALESTGAGSLGLYPWLDPVIESVMDDSPADRAGLESGDSIVAVNEVQVAHSLAVRSILSNSSFPVDITVSRNGAPVTVTATGETDPTTGVTIGVAFVAPVVRSPDRPFFAALGYGVERSWNVLAVSVRGLRNLFRGVEVSTAVAGPVRIVGTIGQVATTGFSVGFGVGMLAFSTFLASISVILFFMNLLPIPILDGGQIILATVEWVRGRGPKPKAVYRYQLVGSVLILGILVFALFGDALYIIGR